MQKQMRGFALWMSALTKSSAASSTTRTTTHLLPCLFMLLRTSVLWNADLQGSSACILWLCIQFFLSLCKCMLLTYWFVFVHRYIRRAKPDAGFPLFQSESLKWPGFVEFDDVNAKVLTYSAQDRYFPSLFLFLFHFYCVRFPPVILSYPLLSNDNSIYKVFDLKNYTMLYSISDRNVQEIKIRYFSRFRLIFCFTVSVSAKTPFW
jgi:hypothetical protein